MIKNYEPITFAGVTRSTEFSPNHVGNDAAIFNATCRCLENYGVRVKVYTEQDFISGNIAEPLIFNMVRDVQAIKKLCLLEKEDNCIVINSGFGIQNCTREKMTRLLMHNNVPHPRSVIVGTDEDIHDIMQTDVFVPCWIKRGDFHAIHREDVSYVRNADEAQSLLQEYAMRGIRTAVINEHLKGDLIKFYGVAQSNFFYWFYPFDMNHSKFGLEKINGQAQGFKFDEQHLRHICMQAADVLDVKVYGGDCIVAEDGSVRIIDFNDWPSFAPCRDAAAEQIAACIYKSFCSVYPNFKSELCDEEK